MYIEELRQRTFGPDKILGPEHAEHIQGVVIRAINLHARLGIVCARIADTVAQALTGKEMRSTTGAQQQTSARHITLDSPQPGVSAEQLEALIAHGREHGNLYLVTALTELRELRAMSAHAPASSVLTNPYATDDLEVARHTLRGLEGHLGKQDFGALERGLNAAGAALEAQETPSEDRARQSDQCSPVTYVDLRTGQPVAEDAPPACAAHGGPPGASPLMTKTLYDKIEINPGEPQHMKMLKIAANATLEEAAKLDAGKTYSAEFRADGWKIAIETPHGIVGLWSCWLGNQFHLGYPGPQACPVSSAQIGTLIEKHLGVKQAAPVLQVDATAVDSDYTGEYKDPDKPLEVTALGQFIAYRARGLRLWATYCGPRVSSNTQEPGRIWVEHSNFCSTATDFRFITVNASEVLSTVWYGHDSGQTIQTFPYTFANRHAPEGPTADPDHVQPYRDRFLSLACDLAEVLGGATAVNVDYGFLMTPVQLGALGYGEIRWIKGSPTNYLGWGNEVVLASRRLPDTRVEHLLLRSGNQMVPWSAIRRIPTGELTTQVLLSLLTF